MLKRSMIFATALVASLSLGLTALAAPSVDTLLTAGYDADEMRLIFGTSDVYDEDSPRAENNENSLDCGVEKGLYDYDLDTTDTDDADGTLVGALSYGEGDNAGDDVEFVQEKDVDDTEAHDYLAPADYGTDEAEECDLVSFSVDRNGDEEANHGEVVSAFVHMIKDAGFRGAGCMVRFVSQTEWGKEDLTTDFVSSEEGGTVLLESFAAACNLAKKDGAHKADNPGKSDQAKGPAWKLDDTVDRPGKGKNK
jgi:hypothetical protein